MVKNTENTKMTYRMFYTSEALKQYAEERGIPVCMAAREVLRTPSPLDTCLNEASDARTLTAEERATEGKIAKALKWL